MLTFVAFAVGWQVFAIRARNILIPTFTDTLLGLVRVLTTVDLVGPFADSNTALALGYGLSVLIGLPLGLLTGRVRLAERLWNPYIGVLLALPIAPLIPIAVIALGLGMASRVTIIVLFTFVYLTVTARAGVRQIDPSLVEMARSYGATERQIWRRIILPGAAPAIFAGLRLGLGRAFLGMVVVELLLVASGIGKLLQDFAGRLQDAELFATVLLIIAESLLLLAIMRWIEVRVTPWAQVDPA